MKKILFVLQKYNDQTAQNALCVKGIIEKIDKKYSIDILSLDFFNCKDTKQNVCSIYHKNQTSILGKISYLFSFPIVKNIEDEFYSKGKELLLKRNYDYVIVIENPIESIGAFYKLRKMFDFKFIILEIDPASNKYKKSHHLAEMLWNIKSTFLEKKFFKSADWIFHMNTHKTHFNSKKYSTFAKKSSYLDIPFIDESYYCPSTDISNNEIRFLYGGAFYEKTRNPFPPLNIMEKLFQKINGHLDIYTRYDYVKKLNNVFGNNKHFSIKDVIPNDEIKKEIFNADVLVSIGNKKSDFLPSKTIQYISTGRPIIHFVYDNYDASISYLNRYPNCLIVNCNNKTEDNVNLIISFINKKFDLIPFEYIKEEFKMNTFEWNAKQIMEVLYEL